MSVILLASNNTSWKSIRNHSFSTYAKFYKQQTFITCVSEGKKCSHFGKFCVHVKLIIPYVSFQMENEQNFVHVTVCCNYVRHKWYTLPCVVIMWGINDRVITLLICFEYRTFWKNHVIFNFMPSIRITISVE